MSALRSRGTVGHAQRLYPDLSGSYERSVHPLRPLFESSFLYVARLGRVLLHFERPWERLAVWLHAAFWLLLLAGALCGFSQNDGNRNPFILPYLLCSL